MSESLRNDGRIRVPARKRDTRSPNDIPEGRARLLPRAPGEDPYTVPMRIYPAPHYTMGALCVD
jgi:succinate dehydrogenase/fumarate reductase flavoprotein subunit